MRFQELVDKNKDLFKPSRAGVKARRCAQCGEPLMPSDTKIYTRESGACHYYPCYLDFKGLVGLKGVWEKLTEKGGKRE